MQKFLSVGQLARRLHLAEDTVRTLADDGEIASQRTTGGHRRFPESAVERYEARHNLAQEGKKPARPKRGRAKAPSAPIFDEIDDMEEGMIDDFDELPNEDVPVARATRASQPGGAQVADGADRAREDEGERKQQAATEAARLQALKAHGMAVIPYDIPPTVKSRIIEELEGYVTSDRLPQWVAVGEQRTLVKGRVDAIVDAHRKKVREEAAQRQGDDARRVAEETAGRAAAAAATRARADAARRRQGLLNHGKRYADDELREFPMSGRWKLRSEIEKALGDEVEADWTERDVEGLVDEILDEQGDDEDNDD